ncbi:MAG: Glu-tRNA(Gln) amidotransferase subunit GatE [Nanoarchaeota archaeon]
MSYEKAGLKCGIEIHQQLEGKKLFCDCPTKLREDAPSFTVKRKLRAVAGEHGEIDTAALQEQLKDKTFVYQGYDSVCLVEADCEPPHEVNKDALYTTLQLCGLVKADVSSIVQVMRKTVIDGSNTSGFQRTALIARNGAINTSGGEVRITSILLEEDACRTVSETPAEKVYSLDRLGIPLIEIGTAPDIKSPQQCLEAAKKIGLLLRSLPGVKRGLGTIRQDVNISIRDGARIEIKGAQDLQMLPMMAELEVKRQTELLRIKEELKGVRLDEFNAQDLTVLLQDSSSKIVQRVVQRTIANKEANKENQGKIMGIKLHGFAGFIGREIQPNCRLGTEFSQRAKVKAGVGGIFHSDELPNYGITEQEVKRIRKKLDCLPADAFVLVADNEHKALAALQAVYERAKETLKGVPEEVRKANTDGTSTYMRPMPGAARMYPETDVPLIKPDLQNIKLPELLENKIARYQKELKLSKDLAEFTAKSGQAALFEELAAGYPQQKPAFIAETLTSTPLEIKRKYNLDADKLTDDDFRSVFKYLQEGKIHKDILIDVLIDMIKGEFDLRRYASLKTEEIHQELKKIVRENRDAPFSALMGLAMKKLARKVSGKVLSEELKRIVEEGH